MIAIVAIGQHLVILTRGIDLSVGANLALATVIGGLVFRVADSALLVSLAMLLTGFAVGAINGIVYVFGRLPHPFIVTLATLSICRGLALELAIGHTTMRGMPEAITVIGGSSTFGMPNSFFVVLAVAAAVLLMAKAMVWGRWIYAVGGAPEAALEMGIPVKGVLISTYMISGLCAGIGAVVLAGRTAASSPLYGNLLELDTIAAHAESDDAPRRRASEAPRDIGPEERETGAGVEEHPERVRSGDHTRGDKPTRVRAQRDDDRRVVVHHPRSG